MKRALICFLPFIVMLAAACRKLGPTVIAPLGNFSGVFTRIHYTASTKKYDTLKAGLNVVIDINTGFAVSGDTTVHTASHGDFYTNATQIEFDDYTYAQLLNKVHLNGVYDYTYDGSLLQFSRSLADTLRYSYALRKQ